MTKTSWTKATLASPYRETRPEWGGYHMTHPVGTAVLVDLEDVTTSGRVRVSFGGEDPLSTERHYLPVGAVVVAAKTACYRGPDEHELRADAAECGGL